MVYKNIGGPIRVMVEKRIDVTIIRPTAFFLLRPLSNQRRVAGKWVCNNNNNNTSGSTHSHHKLTNAAEFQYFWSTIVSFGSMGRDLHLSLSLSFSLSPSLSLSRARSFSLSLSRSLSPLSFVVSVNTETKHRLMIFNIPRMLMKKNVAYCRTTIYFVWLDSCKQWKIYFEAFNAQSTLTNT